MMEDEDRGRRPIAKQSGLRIHAGTHPRFRYLFLNYNEAEL